MATEYVKVETIIAMISAVYKNVPIAEVDIAQWCGECIEEIGEYTAMKYENVELEIHQNRALLPCNVIRVLHVEPHGHGVLHHRDQILNYRVEHPYIKFVRYSGKIKVSYLGIPEDEVGYPLIDRKARQACFYYAIKKLKAEDYSNGLVKENVWQDWSRNEEYYIGAARGNMGNMTRDDLNKITKVMFNMVAKPFLPNTMQ